MNKQILALTLASVSLIATSPAFAGASYSMSCGISQGQKTVAGEEKYVVIKEVEAPIRSDQDAKLSIDFKSVSGEHIRIYGLGSVMGNEQMSFANILFSLEFPDSKKSIQNIKAAQTQKDVSGDVLDNSLSFSVGEEIADHFEAGCTIKKYN
jgi:hypothetical protein